MPGTFMQVQDAAQQAKLSRLDFDKPGSRLNGLLTDFGAELARGDVHQIL